jgi:hypothetical protein
MRLIRNSGTDRVIDELRRSLSEGGLLDIASPSLSLFAFSELRELLAGLSQCRLVLPTGPSETFSFLGSDSDRPYRNRLQAHWLAKQCVTWLQSKTNVREVAGIIPQATLIVRRPDSTPERVINGSASFTTEGLGITPGNQFSLIQCSENDHESEVLGSWFASLWASLSASPAAKDRLTSALLELNQRKPPSLIYHGILGSQPHPCENLR